MKKIFSDKQKYIKIYKLSTYLSNQMHTDTYKHTHTNTNIKN